MRKLTSVLFVALSGSAIWACASSTPEAQTPAEPKSESESSAAPAARTTPEPLPSTWQKDMSKEMQIALMKERPLPATWQKDMSKEMQIAFMKERVTPPMSAVFKQHDAKGFANFGCETCHGPEYKTPTQYLPALSLKDGKLTCFETDPEISQWMLEKVVPAMADAMGMPPYNPETHQGFGCGGCHAIEPG